MLPSALRVARSTLCAGIVYLVTVSSAHAQLVTVGGGLLLTDRATDLVAEVHAETPPFFDARGYLTASWTDEGAKPTLISAAEVPVLRVGGCLCRAWCWTAVGRGERLPDIPAVGILDRRPVTIAANVLSVDRVDTAVRGLRLGAPAARRVPPKSRCRGSASRTGKRTPDEVRQACHHTGAGTTEVGALGLPNGRQTGSRRTRRP